MRRILPALLALVLLAPVPATGSRLFVAGEPGVLASDDAGRTWSPLAVPGASRPVAIAAVERPESMLLLDEDGDVLRTDDGGASWRTYGSLARPALDLAVSPLGAVFALAADGSIHISIDGGAGFRPVAAVDAATVAGITVDRDGTVYVATTTGAILAGENAGAEWVVRTQSELRDVVTIRRSGDGLFLVSGEGVVYRSGDGGNGWVAAGTVPVKPVTAMTGIADGLAVLAADGTVATSPDGGVWTIGGVGPAEATALGSDLAVTADALVKQGDFLAAPPRPNPYPGSGPLEVTVRLPGPDSVQLQIHGRNERVIAIRGAEGLDGPGVFTLTWEPGRLLPGVYRLRIRSTGGLEANVRLVVG